MKSYRTILISFVLGLLVGAGSLYSYFRLTRIPTLTYEFAKHGVTREKIVRLEVVGDENSYTAGKRVRIADPATIDFIWERCIETAAPYEFWLSSGARRLDFYVSDTPERVAATLYVNETDSSNLKDGKHAYMCHGLEAVLVSLLTGKDGGKQTSNNAVELTAAHFAASGNSP